MSVILFSHSDECHSDECHSDECHSDECYSDKCHSSECHSAVFYSTDMGPVRDVLQSITFYRGLKPNFVFVF